MKINFQTWKLIRQPVKMTKNQNQHLYQLEDRYIVVDVKFMVFKIYCGVIKISVPSKGVAVQSAELLSSLFKVIFMICIGINVFSN